MRMRQKISLFPALVAALVACGLAGCGSSDAGSASTQSSESSRTALSERPGEPTTIQVAGPVSPPSLPVLRMIQNNALGEDVSIEFSSWVSADELTGFVSGGYDFVAAPLTTGATLFTKGMDVRLLNVSAWDVMNMVTTDPTIESIEDLEGKTIHVAMKGSAVDYSTQAVLNAHGLTVGENVTIEYISPTEGAPQLIAGQIDTLVTVQPQITAIMAQRPDASDLIDFKSEWQALTDSDLPLPTAGMFISGDIAEENPELADRFREEYAEAADWVSKNPAEAGKLAEEYLGIDKDMFAAAVPHIDWTAASATEAKPAVELYFNEVYGIDPAGVGGSLPEATFYFGD